MEQCFYLKEHFVMDYMIHHPRKFDWPLLLCERMLVREEPGNWAT